MSLYEIEVRVDTRLPDAPPDMKERIRRAVELCLESEGAEPCEVAVTLSGDDFLRELNKTYRGIDSPTDVLSFPLDLGDDLELGGASLPPEAARHLGDVVVSLERAKAQAEEYGHSLERELAFLVVHGTLHLLGFDHEDEEGRRTMREREEAVLARLGLAR